MGETRVDLLHLLEDLRDAYPGSLEETILTEIMANALDSGASLISFATDATQRTLRAVDNGSGMQRRELARFHDIAASSKVRGQGIGFAGIGIKLGLLICEEVLTETRRGKSHVASSWHMASRHRAPWKWTPPQGLLSDRGTAVRLRLRNPLSPLLDPGFIEEMLRRHFQPLLDPTFDEFLAAHYQKDVVIEANGRVLERQRSSAPLQAPVEIRLLRKRKPSALGYLMREDHALAEDRRGLAISTYGKVIRRGWEWLGLTPPTPERIGGVIEVPELAACLTLNKGDFIRTGSRGATYLAFRKAIQQAVTRQLGEWGDAPPASDQPPPREVRPLQRDLAHLLENLADDFPLLASLVERRSGGQKRLLLGAPVANGEAHAFVATSIGAAAHPSEGAEREVRAGLDNVSAENSTVNEPASNFAAQRDALQLPAKTGPRRPAHYGLDIQFEDRSEDVNLARLVESTVWINRAHPAYCRALASRSIGYHIALAVAMALAPLAVEPQKESLFLLTFLTRWGEAVEKSRSPKRAGVR
ncbi:MAG TPA: ATP-binding protein [Candidatus Binatia bacterium]|nr:ATP-binding protein [Candidatus Binatia bacterium]